LAFFNCRWQLKVIKASSWIAANSINCWVDWTCETDVGGDDTDELVNFLQLDF
jgi:hypothetical protein